MKETAQHHCTEQEMLVHRGYWPPHEVCRNDEMVQCMKHFIYFKSKVMMHRIYKARSIQDQNATVKWNSSHEWALSWTSHNYSPWELPVQACVAKQPVIVWEAHYILFPSLIVGLPWLSDPTICSNFNFLLHGVASLTQGNAYVPSFRSIRRTKRWQITERDINAATHNMTRKW